MKSHFPPERWGELVYGMLQLKNAPMGEEKLRSLWQLWARQDERLRQARSIRFYRTTLLTIPERLKDKPIRRELLYELSLEE